MNGAEVQFEGYNIKINPVPDSQFDFDGFGWAFQIFNDNLLCFRLVIKTARSEKTDDNKLLVMSWAKRRIYSLINTQDFEMGAEYCYMWTGLPTNNEPEVVDCEEFLKRG